MIDFTTMKKLSLCIAAALFFSLQAGAQYYYTDLVTQDHARQQYQLLKASRAKGVKIVSFEADGSPSEGFFCEQKIIGNISQIRTTSGTQVTGRSMLTSYYNAAGQLYRSSDSTNESLNISYWSYDSLGRINSITNTSAESVKDKMPQTEQHNWYYASNGKPEKMVRIKGKNDTTVVTFGLDEKGNIAEERIMRNGQFAGKYYYYYDEQNRLTDIARFNERANRILPEYIFTYNDQGRLYEMTAFQPGSSGYIIWRYLYNDNGLKTKEVLYNKDKQFVGKMEYSYL
jgi:hypothetical protein